MSASESLRKGWCPGALRPMETGDGLLLRVKPRAGAFSVDALAAIAETAALCGSGDIDLTNRANLQLRGLDADHYSQALEILGRAGLLDAHAEAEAVRNVVVDPLSGIDEDRSDMTAHAATLEKRLGENPTLWELPAKFAISLSGGAQPALGGRAADIMSFVRGGEYALALDGDFHGCALLGTTALPEAIERLLYVFLTLKACDTSIRRMRYAVARNGSRAIFAAGGLKRIERELAADCRLNRFEAGAVGRGDRIFAVGLGLPFGRIGAAELKSLSVAMRRLGVAGMRPGASRVMFFEANASQSRELILLAPALGLITRADDVRLAMDVCPGAPACRNGTTATRQDAQKLAEQLQKSGVQIPRIHISGCVKGCARREAAAVTFVAREGRYDIVRDGKPGDTPCCSGVSQETMADVVTNLLMGRPL